MSVLAGRFMFSQSSPIRQMDIFPSVFQQVSVSPASSDPPGEKKRPPPLSDRAHRSSPVYDAKKLIPSQALLDTRLAEARARHPFQEEGAAGGLSAGGWHHRAKFCGVSAMWNREIATSSVEQSAG